MMKVFKNSLKFLMILSIFVPFYNVHAEKMTYGQVLDDLAKAQKELKENNQSINNKENQIKTDTQTIKNLKNEIEAIGNETVKLQQEIADSTTEIENKQQQTKSIIAYLQMSQGENIYLEYVFEGDSITDLVYRLSVVEQITEYNDKVVKDLQNLIVANENRKVELAKKEAEHEKKIEKLNSEVASLNKSITELGDLAPSLEQEVKSKEELVAYYKKQGCKNRTDVIGVDCATTSTNAYFSRPITKGYVTSFVGYRWGKLHRGIDIGSPTGKNTALYSIGNGVITKIWKDAYGALCVNIEYKTTKGEYYTASYAHLSKYASGIYVGKKVDVNSIIGYMGDTGYAFGVHLHLELYPCRYGVDSNCNTWNKYVSFAEKKFKEGFKGAESVISFPTKTYQYWYSR